MKFYDDLQTINLIVNTSKTQDEARERFFKTVGFALPEPMAKQELEDAIRKRFIEQPETKQEISRLASLISKPTPHR